MQKTWQRQSKSHYCCPSSNPDLKRQLQMSFARPVHQTATKRRLLQTAERLMMLLVELVLWKMRPPPAAAVAADCCCCCCRNCYSCSSATTVSLRVGSPCCIHPQAHRRSSPRSCKHTERPSLLPDASRGGAGDQHGVGEALLFVNRALRSAEVLKKIRFRVVRRGLLCSRLLCWRWCFFSLKSWHGTDGWGQFGPRFTSQKNATM